MSLCQKVGTKDVRLLYPNILCDENSGVVLLMWMLAILWALLVPFYLFALFSLLEVTHGAITTQQQRRYHNDVAERGEAESLVQVVRPGKLTRTSSIKRLKKK